MDFYIFWGHLQHTANHKRRAVAARDKYDSTTSLLTQTQVVQKKPTQPNFTTLLQTAQHYTSAAVAAAATEPSRNVYPPVSDEACRHHRMSSQRWSRAKPERNNLQIIQN
jgi:hypothetical protein